MVIDYVFELSENFYSQTFLEECKYKKREQVLKSFINEYVENSENDDDSEE